MRSPIGLLPSSLVEKVTKAHACIRQWGYTEEILLRMVDLTGASWNLIRNWARRVEALKRIALPFWIEIPSARSN